MRFNGLKKWPLRLVSSIAVCAAVPLGVVLLAPGLPAWAADKPATFQAKAVDQYPHRQTSEGVTIAAEAFTTDDQAKTAFGKVNPWRYNILPILVVIRNDSPNAVRLEKMHLEYELPDGSRMNTIAASDVKYSQGANRPKLYTGPLGNLKVGGPSKNPLSAPEIEIRAFAAKMLPPGETASGFFYFETDLTSAGASLYISGLENASTGKQLYYFEIPLSGK